MVRTDGIKCRSQETGVSRQNAAASGWHTECFSLSQRISFMRPQVSALLVFGAFCTVGGWGQSVPIYQVTVIERTVKAVNYQYRGGQTRIDFAGTVLLPDAKGEALVESKA